MVAENTRGCPLSFWEENLPSYDIVRIDVDPADICCTHGKRPRSYFLCTRRATCVVKHDFQTVYNLICKAIRKKYANRRPTQARDVLLADCWCFISK